MTYRPCIAVLCSGCGVVRVSPCDVTVLACADDGAWSYRFTCAHCRRQNTRDGAMTALMDAVDAGAGFEAWTRPTNIDERPRGAPFDRADVLELRRLMLEPDWLDHVIGRERDPER